MTERTGVDFPTPFLEAMQRRLGAEYPDFLAALRAGGAAGKALRVNPLRAGAEAAAAPFVAAPVPWARYGFYTRPDARPGASLAHFAGAFYVQEASAMSSAAVLDAQPGERVLDLCAAPGGKASQIAGALAGKGVLVANEPEPGRARALAGNLERLGVPNCIVTNAYPERLRARFTDWFDAVLVDAPCSGEGMFARDPAARAEWTEASPEGCARRQAEILDAAAAMVRPGGRLGYSTCTFNEVENEGSVAGFLARHLDFAPEDFALPGLGASSAGMLHVYPHRVRGDGHFVARLRRAGAGKEAPFALARPGKPDARLQRLHAEVAAELPEAVDAARLETFGERLYAVPAALPELSGVKLALPGLCLLRAGRSHIEPEHALAMALRPGQARRTAALSEEQARAWCAGQAIECPGERGWTWVTWEGLPLGWGKRSDDVLKNHLPKGLRRRFEAGEEEI